VVGAKYRLTRIVKGERNGNLSSAACCRMDIACMKKEGGRSSREMSDEWLQYSIVGETRCIWRAARRSDRRSSAMIIIITYKSAYDKATQ